jgi:lipopolysaccharide export system permease protein
MSSLTRYVLRQALILTLAFTVVFSAAVWLVQALRLIDMIVNRGLSAAIFLQLAILIFPRFVEIVLPIAIFLAVLFSYNRLIAESEFVVMRAAGVSQGMLARPALILAGGGTIVLLLLSTYFLPASYREFKDLQFQVRSRFASALIQEGVFNTISDSLTIYVRNRDRRGELTGLLVHDTRDAHKPVTVFAERGALVDTQDGPRILMVNGTRQQLDRATGKLTVLSFDSYTVDLAGGHDASSMRYREPEEYYFHELILDDTGNPRLALEIHMRLAAPLAALVFAVIPLVCLLPSEFDRRGQGRRILTAILLALLFEASDFGVRTLVGRDMMAWPLLYADALLPIAIGMWAIMREGRWPWTGRPVPPAMA